MFNKFPKILNIESYSDEELDSIIKDCLYIDVYEKIDGSHIGISIDVDTGTINCFTRNGNRFDLGNFNSTVAPTLLPRLSDIVKDYSFCLGSIKTIYLDGEVYGKRVINRLPYPEDTHIVFYQIMLLDSDGELVNYNGIINLMKKHLNDLWESPIARIYNYPSSDIKQEIKDNTVLPFNSSFTIADSPAEGYVLYFYFKDKILPLMIKVKDDMFKAIGIKKVSTIETNWDYDKLAKLKEEFLKYIDDNRIIDTVSKGYTTINDIVKTVMSDAKEDFLRENPNIDLSLSNNEMRYIFNVGKQVYEKCVELHIASKLSNKDP